MAEPAKNNQDRFETGVRNARRIRADDNWVSKKEYTDEGNVVPFYKAANDNAYRVSRNTSVSDDYSDYLERRTERSSQPRANTTITYPNSDPEAANTRVRRPRFKKYLNRSRSPAIKGALNARGNLKKGKKTLSAVAATGFIVSWTVIPYLIQLLFAFISIVGLGMGMAGEEFLWGILDTVGLSSNVGGTLMSIGMVVTFIATFFSTLFAFLIYTSRAVPFWKGASLIILGLCWACSFAPILNIAPWTWFWCLYVIKSQMD